MHIHNTCQSFLPAILSKKLSVFILTIVFLLSPGLVLADHGLTRSSVSSSGFEGNGMSERPKISADGRYVAFSSLASNLVPNDTNGKWDVFVHDRQTGQTTRVSVSSTGVQGDDDSRDGVSISADGRYVAFASKSSNLATFNPQDTFNNYDIFVHDRQTGQTTQASLTSSGAFANGPSGNPHISDDGQMVAFRSLATNFDAVSGSLLWSIFVHNRTTGQTTRVSQSNSGAKSNGHSVDLAISGNGQVVAYSSVSTNLVTGDTNASKDIFVRDLVTNQTTRVSVSSSGAQGNKDSNAPVLTADGKLVAFSSFSSNLVSSDTNNFNDIFLHDRTTGETIRLSVPDAGGEADGSSTNPGISANGRYVTYDSEADNLGSVPPNGFSNVFALNRNSHKTTLITGTGAGWGYPVMTGDGQDIAFHSSATNLVSGDTNGVQDIFVGHQSLAQSNQADFNGDNKGDLIWRNTTNGSTTIWLMDGTTVLSTGSPGGAGLEWTLSGVGDLDGDRKADLIWRNTNTGSVAVWLLNGTSIKSSGFPGNVANEWAIRGVGDLNGDGKSDIVWRDTSNGATAIWLMNGASILSTGFPGGVGLDWVIRGVGDFNGDGRFDIFWRNTNNNDTAVWLMNGTAITGSGFPGGVGAEWANRGVGDLNKDGKSDLIWQDTNTTSVAMWLMNGVTISSSGFLSGLGAPWTIKGVSDVNGDGKIDFVWRNTSTGDTRIWLMDGTTMLSSGSPGIIGLEWQLQPVN